MKLLSVGTNPKTSKGDRSSDYLTAIMYMAPHKLNTKGVNLCPYATKGCSEACLNTAGRGSFTTIQTARVKKADFWVSHREEFLRQLHEELLNFSRYSRLRGKKPAVRLNGTTDIPWERYLDFSLYPEIQFYDYTKWSASQRTKALHSIPNYHLTFSRTEDTPDLLVSSSVVLGNNVAVVFNEIPKEYLGLPVFDGDQTDLRFLDPTGHIIGLTAKGKGKKDTSGFVVRAY